MQKRTIEYKMRARINLSGTLFHLIRALIFCNLAVSIIELPFSLTRDDVAFSTSNIIYYVAVVLITTVAVVLRAGLIRLHLTLARTKEVHLSEVFYPIKHSPDRYIITELILLGIDLLCAIPALLGAGLVYFHESTLGYVVASVASVISIVLITFVSITYELVYFVMNDNEGLSPIAALKQTRQMMKGHKLYYLDLQYSFLGWHLLSTLTLGIAGLYVEPYLTQTITLFYLDIIGEKERIQNEQENRQTTIDYYC